MTHVLSNLFYSRLSLVVTKGGCLLIACDCWWSYHMFND